MIKSIGFDLVKKCFYNKQNQIQNVDQKVKEKREFWKVESGNFNMKFLTGK